MASAGWARSTTCRSSTTWVTIQTSQPTCSARNCIAPSAAAHQSGQGVTSAMPCGTIPNGIPAGSGKATSAGAGQPVVLPVVLRPLLALELVLLGLGLQEAGLAAH